MCLTKQSFSHPAQHVARAFLVVSFTHKHYLTFHMHSNPTFYSTDFPCADPSNESFGPMAETHSPTGYETNDLTEMNNTEFTPIFFHRSCVTSTYDSAESVATIPPESDLDDKQIRDMLASPLYLQEREKEVQTNREFMTLTEKAMSSSSRFRASAVKLAAMFSHKRKSSQESHSDRDGTPLAHRAGQGENEALSRLSESEK